MNDQEVVFVIGRSGERSRENREKQNILFLCVFLGFFGSLTCCW